MKRQRLLINIIGALALIANLMGSALLAGTPPALASGSTPILLIVNSAASNKFGVYLGEILRAEGLNAFDQVELSSLTPAQLAQYDLAILAQMPLNGTQVNLLTSYVSAGGALLAMRPDPQMAALFGLTQAAGTLSNGYLQIQNNAVYNGAAPGFGLTSATLQIHGDADQYSMASGAVSLAQLYSNASTSTVYPAVVAANSGSGQAVAFTYDLASNVVYTRQGNPANANVDVDGDYNVRTIDLFETVGGGAPWVDLNRVPIPQADEQQRLFARLVQQMVGRLHPMPQLWYFPQTAKTMLVLTGDAHDNADTLFTNEMASMDAHQGKITLYLSTRLNPWDPPSNAEVVGWQAEGHTFGLHPWLLDGSTLAAGYASNNSWFKAQYPTVSQSHTVRNHRLVWTGWTTAAEIAATYGIAMDTSFYNWGAWLKKSDGTWAHGYLTGSGQPMKFMRADGTLVPVYQQLTELVDEQMLVPADPGYQYEGLNAAQALAVSKTLINASLAGDYAAVMTQNHVDFYSGQPQLWAEGLMDYARSQAIPIWNADQWLSFTQTRHDANYTNLAWNATGGVLSFNIVMQATAGLTATTILPLNYGARPLQSVTVDGQPYATSVQMVKSVNVAFVSIPAGNHAVSATYGGSAPTSTATPVPPTATKTATGTTVPPTATNTATVTGTILPPTVTNTPTVTPVPPTATNTATVTNTPLPPTATNTATSTATPTAPPVTLVDTTVADFSAGTLGTCAYIAQTVDGEVLLTPTVGAEFSGTVLPTGWFATPWDASGSVVIGSGAATVNGELMGTNAYFTPGRSLEFVATFRASTSQHMGFGTDLNAGPWAIFSTGYPGGTTLQARTLGTTRIDTDLGASYLGAPHRYRIDWTSTSVVYYIDGVQVASHAIGTTATMRPVASDQPGGNVLTVDWLRLSPYAGTCDFVSRVMDGGDVLNWLNLTWTASQPTGTSLAFQTRTSTDGVSWSGWTALGTGGLMANPAGRYLQYRATVTSSDPFVTPALQQIVVTGQLLTGPTSTPTATNTSTVTPVPPTATNTATATPVPPTVTNTATATPVPPTATNTATATPVPPTATNTATATPVPPTATNTATATPVPPTATNTPTATPVPPTATNTATATPVPSTATATQSLPADTPTATATQSLPADTPTATATQLLPADTPTATATQPLPADTPTATATQSLPADTPTATNTATATPVPPTATNTATATPVPPTATNTATATSVPPTATNTATATPVPPTATNTATATPVPPTATNTATATPVPPTATNTATATPVPPTATNTATATPVPPTATNTATATPVPPTATNTATATPVPPTATNTATSTATPTAPPVTLVDSTVADFSAGTLGTCAYIAQTVDGEVLLTPTVGAEFSGTALPTGWFATPWDASGSVVVGSGAATVNGALMGTNAYFASGRSLEFVATFRASTSQHIGFGTDLNAAPWAIFSTGYPGGTTLQARTFGATRIDTDLGASYLGAPHRYRIDWTSTSVVYYIDGVQVASHAIGITATMRPVASDQPGGNVLTVDWMRLSPYAATCDFTSRVMDGGSLLNWQTMTWVGSQPAGTGVTFQTRTSTDGVSWSSWTALGTGGLMANPAGRYLQYRASLSTTNTMISPAVERVSVSN